jgi:hypothetical protein
MKRDMTVENWIHILQHLPPHMEVYVPSGDGYSYPVCGESDIEEVDEEGIFKKVFLLRACTHRDDLPINTDTNPN